MFSFSLQISIVLSSITLALTLRYAGKLRTWNEEGSISSVYATVGRRSAMEDTFIRIEGEFGSGIFGIFDGHSGGFSSSFAKDYFTAAIMDELDLYAADPKSSKYANGPNGELNFEQMLVDFIAETEIYLKAAAIHNLHNSGTTCLLVIAEDQKLTVANVGDSRGVMCDLNGKAIELTIDHRPDDENERRRIEGKRGKVEFDGVWRVRGLAMSRSLGDSDRKLDDKVISSKPDIFTYNLDKHRPEFMILASDGLWEVMTSQDAVDYIRLRYFYENDFGARALVHRAFQLNSSDNIAVIIAVFRNGRYEVGSANTYHSMFN